MAWMELINIFLHYNSEWNETYEYKNFKKAEILANKSKRSRQTNVQENVDFIPSVQAAQHPTRPPLSYAQQLLGTHYQHWEAVDGLNLLPTYGMDVPTIQIYAPQLQPTQNAVFGAWDEFVRSNLPLKN
ncbi:hypothetical protein Fot_21719 [Forsythia ovata]|uniref:Uncharacterized protein n=1 Tax=Forsythia ovata TaxID=205694 RepID=A0ABD1UWN2_9LAMI